MVMKTNMKKRKKVCKKLAFKLFISVFVLTFGIIGVRAQDDINELPEEYGDYIDSLPDNLTDTLPDGTFSENVNDVADAVSEMTGFEFLLNEFTSYLGGGIKNCLPSLIIICGLLLVAATGQIIGSSLSGNTSRMFEMCSRMCIFSSVAATAVASLDSVRTYFDSLCTLMWSFVPLSGVLYAMGGNLTAAASMSTGLSVTLAICEFVCTYTVIPIFCVCLCFSLISAFDPSSGVSSLGASVKKWYTTLLSFVMMIITTSVSAQTFISAKADNAAMRGAKFAAGAFIPVSGGTVASSLGTVASSVELLRGAVGTGGIIILLLMLLPVIIELILMRMVFGICSFIAGVLGCQGEKKLLDDICGLYGYLEGVAVLCTVVFIIALAIFASCASAVGN